ncbi:hypothetical protein JD969_08780 [Planctomycetota bacterium]|nr:hypothetical protein JD969_08780 [Planctomycetota bacterium]
MKEYLHKWFLALNDLSFKAKVMVLLIAGVVVTLIVGTWTWPGEPEQKQAVNYEQNISSWVQDLLAINPNGSGISRRDAEGQRWVYGVDVGFLLQYAALSENKELYSSIRGLVTQHLIVSADKVSGYTNGTDNKLDLDRKLINADFVAWRYPTKRTIDKNKEKWASWEKLNQAGEPIDATGTTEALRIAEGLWIGAKVFESDEDKALSLRILRGYAAHGYVDQGVWMIRNYINLQTGAGATNSYSIDYDADFVGMVAAQTGDEQLRDVAEKTRQLMLKLKSEAGLIHSMIQPEIKTLMSPLPGAIYSPNRVEQVNNVVSVAERCAMMNREVAEGVYKFCINDLGQLNKYYDAGNGDRVGRYAVGIGTYAPLLRLSIRMNDRAGYEKVLPLLLWQVRDMTDCIAVERKGGRKEGKDVVSVYEMGEALLSLRLAQLYYDYKGPRLMLPGYVDREAKTNQVLDANKVKEESKKDRKKEGDTTEGEEKLPMIMPVQIEPPNNSS